MVAGRWLLRSIGFISTIILARLLTPADFGLIAMAMLVIGALQVLAETGQRQAIIRLRSPTPEHYDTAWTVGILIGLAITVLLVIAGPLAAAQFEEPRLTWVMWLLALKPLIQSFENIGLVDLQRALNFRRDLQIMLYSKLGGFLVTIALALWFRNYWALIAGTLAQTSITVLLSYVFSRYRPRLGLAKVQELWSFSIWSLVTSVATYGGERVDHALVANEIGADALGTYSVGAELGALPTDELVVPPVRALFAVYSRVSHDVVALREHYLIALSFIAVVATSTSTGVALVAEDAVTVVLGARWQAAAPLIPWFALAAGILGVARSVNAVLLAAGHARANAWRAVAFAVALVPLAVIGLNWRGAEGAAIARLAVTMIFGPVMLYLAMRLLAIPFAALVAVLWRPIAAAAVMAVAVNIVHPWLPAVPLLRLGIDAAVGATVFGAMLFLTWVATGRPSGAEATLLKTLRVPWRRGGG